MYMRNQSIVVVKPAVYNAALTLLLNNVQIKELQHGIIPHDAVG